MPQDLIPETPTNAAVQVEEAVVQSQELALDIPDADILAVIEKKITDSKSHFKNKLKIEERQKTNENYWRGKQHEGNTYYEYQKPHTNNIIHRDTETRIAIAAGRMPDIIVIPDNPDDDNSTEDARDFEQYLASKVNSDVTKRLMKNVLRDEEIKLIGCIKVRWDPNRGKLGDVTFERVKSQDIIFDHTATIPEDGYTSDNMEFISEWIEESISLIIAKFPAAKSEFLKKFGMVDETRAGAAKLASKVRYRETWFTWYDTQGKRIEGVCWHYNGLMLDKKKSPYWDWKEDRNHFDMPHKPYMFTSYKNLGYGAHDDTTSIEQAIPMQDVVNKRGMQITEINDRAIPKLVIAGSAMTKEEAERLTPDPHENVYLNADAGADASKAVATIDTPAANPELYTDMQGAKADIDSQFSTHSVTRGEATSDDLSGVSKQITREGDLSIADDIVQIVVQRLVTEMANWATQLMIINYYDPNKGLKPGDEGYDFNFKPWRTTQPGKNGDYIVVSMTRDRIRKGINVIVNSNTIDKPTQRSLAIQLSQEKAIDPYSLFEALEIPNPREKTKRLIAFIRGGGDTGDGYAAYLKEIGIDITDTAAAGGEAGAGDQAQPNPEDDVQLALKDIQTIISGQVPATPQTPSAAYVETLSKFVNSPSFDQVPDEGKQALVAYIDELHKTVDQQGGETAPPPNEVAPQGAAPLPVPVPAQPIQ